MIWLGPDGEKTRDQNPTPDMVPTVSVESPGSKTWVIYSHGNGCDLGDMYPALLLYSNKLNVNFVIYEYPGNYQFDFFLPDL